MKIHVNRKGTSPTTKFYNHLNYTHDPVTTQHNKIRTEGSNEKIKSYKTDTQQILVPLLIKFVHTSHSPFL